MNKIILARINLNQKFSSNVRELIRFQNNALPTISKRLIKLNDSINCPKWIVQLNQAGHFCFLELIEQKGVAFAAYSQNIKKTPDCKSLDFTLQGNEYSLSSSELRDKIKRKTLRPSDIDNHLEKNAKKLKTGVRQIAKHYGFTPSIELMNDDEIGLHKFSFA